ncbi:hypothetical protein DPMN_116235 [Dreissena polymorpha]|uniref:Cadherin domain-containing protein n=1 Tax=Dreissena polymorpha TaxID=45954 RepID=A0A9D4QT90_DREPO|nr:hypothetical protein DPMN_116235 [Dreissena polymorpha]
MVTYNVTGGDHKRQFQIDLYTGVITVASRLDREVTPAYTLTVTATDRGGPQMKSSTVQVNKNNHEKYINFPIFSFLLKKIVFSMALCYSQVHNFLSYSS